ncbi:MAG: Rho termination factor N-terminal domain-containing protein [Campylobacterota bacterium]
MEAIKLMNSAKVGGKLHKAKAVLVVGNGKDIDVKDAEYLVAHGAAEETFKPSSTQPSPKGDELSVEEMAVLDDLSQLKVDDLKKVCEYLGLEKYSSMNKKELIALIEDHRGIVDIDEMDEDALRELAEEEGITLPDDSDIDTIRKIIATSIGE